MIGTQVHKSHLIVVIGPDQCGDVSFDPQKF